jgi:hypothetical protein
MEMAVLAFLNSWRALDGSRLGALWHCSLARVLDQHRSALPFENEFPLPYHPSLPFRQRSLFWNR